MKVNRELIGTTVVIFLAMAGLTFGLWLHTIPKPRPAAQTQVEQTKPRPAAWRCSIEPTQTGSSVKYGTCLVIPAEMFACPTVASCCPSEWVPVGNGNLGCGPICPVGMDCIFVKDYPGHVLTDAWPLADQLAAKDTEIAKLRKENAALRKRLQPNDEMFGLVVRAVLGI